MQGGGYRWLAKTISNPVFEKLRALIKPYEQKMVVV
jgi:hypothetical protein